MIISTIYLYMIAIKTGNFVDTGNCIQAFRFSRLYGSVLRLAKSYELGLVVHNHFVLASLKSQNGKDV